MGHRLHPLRTSAVLGLALAAAGSACDSLTQTLQDNIEVEPPRAAQGPMVDPQQTGPTDEARAEQKLGLYLECLHRSNDRIHESWRRYTTYVDEQRGVLRNRGATPDVDPIGPEIEPCKTAAEHGPRLTPSWPDLEAATAVYTAAAHSFAELSQALDAYYQQAGYESDDWAQGKALAPQFLAAYQAFDHASQALTALLDGERDRVQRQLLAAAEARSGRTLEWYTRKLSLDAGPFATCVADHSAAASECAPQFEALTTAYQGFRAYHDGHKTEAYEVFWMSSFDARAKAYFDAANAFMAAARSPKASTKLAPAVGTAYDALLESSDKLRFEFP